MKKMAAGTENTEMRGWHDPPGPILYFLKGHHLIGIPHIDEGLELIGQLVGCIKVMHRRCQQHQYRQMYWLPACTYAGHPGAERKPRQHNPLPVQVGAGVIEYGQYVILLAPAMIVYAVTGADATEIKA